MQTSIDPLGQPRAFAGLVADSMSVVDVVSSWSEEATAQVAFGWGLVQGTATQGALIPSGSGDKFKGVLAHSYAHAPGTFGDLGTTGIIAGGRLRILRRGRIYVVVDKAVTSIAPFSDRGWLRYTADGSTNPTPGAWGKATDSGKNLDLTECTQFVSPMYTLADGTKIAILEVNAIAKP